MTPEPEPQLDMTITKRLIRILCGECGGELKVDDIGNTDHTMIVKEFDPDCPLCSEWV